MKRRDEKKRSVVVVAYSFPPVGGAGVQRPLKYVKYLREYGWEPIVLTVKNPSVPVSDEGLASDIPPGVQIYRAPTLEPSYRQKASFSAGTGPANSIKLLLKRLLSSVLVPDLQVLWWPWLIPHLIKILLRLKPQAIFVTAPPFSSFLPVLLIGRAFSIPVVVDFRDEWAFSREQVENANRGRWARGLDSLLEKLTVTLCSDFTAATASYVDSIRCRHKMDSTKGCVITNGYDPDDFLPVGAASTETGLRIVYTGTVWKATSLSQFLEAVKQALHDDPELSKRLSLKIVGRVVDTERNTLEEPALKNILEITGYLPHEMAIEEMNRADMLLLTLNDLPGAERIIPGKTFEYMATGKPILAVLPDGETSTLLVQDYPASYVYQPDDSCAISKLLVLLARDKSCLAQRQGSPPVKYSRAALTLRLAEVLNRIVNT